MQVSTQLLVYAQNPTDPNLNPVPMRFENLFDPNENRVRLTFTYNTVDITPPATPGDPAIVTYTPTDVQLILTAESLKELSRKLDLILT